jgi:hypothetical protein
MTKHETRIGNRATQGQPPVNKSNDTLAISSKVRGLISAKFVSESQPCGMFELTDVTLVRRQLNPIHFQQICCH